MAKMKKAICIVQANFSFPNNLNRNVTYAPGISPYIEKHANILFSFTKAYMAYQMQTYTKCIRFMSPSEDMKLLDEGYTCYQLNNIACCHLRMQKYALAAYYFSKALSILQKINKELKEESSSFKKYEALLSLNTVQQYPFILHNYALVRWNLGIMN